MRPHQSGNVAKFQTPMPGQNLYQLYDLLKIKKDVERSKAGIKAINTGFSFSPIITVLPDYLEVVQPNNFEIDGHDVTIKKDDYYQQLGKVIEQKIRIDLVKGIENKIWLTFEDESGKENIGIFFCNLIKI